MEPQELLENLYPGLIDKSLQSVPVTQLELLAALAVVVEDEDDPEMILPAIKAAFALGRWSRERAEQ